MRQITDEQFEKLNSLIKKSMTISAHMKSERAGDINSLIANAYEVLQHLPSPKTGEQPEAGVANALKWLDLQQGYVDLANSMGGKQDHETGSYIATLRQAAIAMQEQKSTPAKTPPSAVTEAVKTVRQFMSITSDSLTNHAEIKALETLITAATQRSESAELGKLTKEMDDAISDVGAVYKLGTIPLVWGDIKRILALLTAANEKREG